MTTLQVSVPEPVVKSGLATAVSQGASKPAAEQQVAPSAEAKAAAELAECGQLRAGVTDMVVDSPASAPDQGAPRLAFGTLHAVTFSCLDFCICCDGVECLSSDLLSLSALRTALLQQC